MKTPVFETEEATRVSIRAEALINVAFVHVIHTRTHEQIAVMMLPPGGEVGEELRPDTDQLFMFVDGVGEARVGEYAVGVEPGDLVFVAAGTTHDIVNRATVPLRLIAVSAPPAYPPGTIVETRSVPAR